MQNQTAEKNVSKSDSSKRHHSIDTPPTPPNQDQQQNGAVKPPFDGPEGGKGRRHKK
jgi:hypothetical protein